MAGRTGSRLPVVTACALFAGLALVRGAAQYYLRAGEDALWAGEPMDALTAYAWAARLDPLSAAGSFGEADALLDAGEEAGLRDPGRLEALEQGRDLLLEVLARDPRSPSAWAQLGRAYAALAAARRAGRVIDISQLGDRAALREPEDDLASRALGRAVELEPHNYDYINYLAELRYRLGEPDALDLFRRAVEVLPRMQDHPHLQATDADVEVIEAAERGARDAVGNGNVVPDHEILAELALFHARRGDYEKALAANAEAIEFLFPFPRHEWLPWLWNRQAVWLAAVGRADDARAALQTTLQLEPGRSAAYFSLGQLAVSEGDLDEAARRFQEARNLAPSSLRVQMALARVLDDADRVEDAAREYQRAMFLEGGEIPAASALVALYRRHRVYDRAIVYARRLAELRPDEPVFQRQLKELQERLVF